jgi:L-ascorbate metabolism protein UlaG (beta-lactamase superfamily)
MPESAVTWWGHSCVLVEVDGVRLLTDPLLRNRIGPLAYQGHTGTDGELDDVDAVLVSHLHRDHLERPSLARIAAGIPILLPAGGEGLLPGPGRSLVGLQAGDRYEIGPVQVVAVHADHDPRRGLGRHTAAALGFVIVGSRSVYFAGDTGGYAGMGRIGTVAGGDADRRAERRLDVALLPVGGWGPNLGAGHLDPGAAAQVAASMRPRLVVPIHWGTLRVPLAWRARPGRQTGPGREFARCMALAAPDVSVVVAAPGQRVPVL